VLNIWNVNSYVYTDKRLNTADCGWQTTDPTFRQRGRPTKTQQQLWNSNKHPVMRTRKGIDIKTYWLPDWPSVVTWLWLRTTVHFRVHCKYTSVSCVFMRSCLSLCYSRISKTFMEPVRSLPFSQESSISPYPELDESNPYHPISMLISSSNLLLNLPIFLLSSGFLTKILDAFFLLYDCYYLKYIFKLSDHKHSISFIQTE
jgi:hypothetical protein